MKRTLLLILILAPLTLVPQNYDPGPRKFAPVTSDPGTCVVGQVEFRSDVTAGSNLKGCTASNTWTTMTGAGVTSLGAQTGVLLIDSTLGFTGSTLGVATAGLTGTFPTLAGPNTFADGGTGIFKPSASAEGIRLVGTNSPSAPTAGALNIDTSNKFGWFNGMAWNYLSNTSTANRTVTIPDANSSTVQPHDCGSQAVKQIDSSGVITCISTGGSPGGSGSEIQYRAGASTFGAVTGSSVSGADVTFTGTLIGQSVRGTQDVAAVPAAQYNYIDANGFHTVDTGKYTFNAGAGYGAITAQIDEPATGVIRLSGVTAGTTQATLQLTKGSTDPTCSAAGDLGKLWIDSTSSTTTHFKVCVNVASSPAWVSVI